MTSCAVVSMGRWLTMREAMPRQLRSSPYSRMISPSFSSGQSLITYNAAQ